MLDYILLLFIVLYCLAFRQIYSRVSTSCIDDCIDESYYDLLETFILERFINFERVVVNIMTGELIKQVSKVTDLINQYVSSREREEGSISSRLVRETRKFQVSQCQSGRKSKLQATLGAKVTDINDIDRCGKNCRLLSFYQHSLILHIPFYFLPGYADFRLAIEALPPSSSNANAPEVVSIKSEGEQEGLDEVVKRLLHNHSARIPGAGL